MARHGTIGIDLGGTKTLVTLFDETFKVVEMTKFKTAVDRGEKVFNRHLTESLEELLGKAKQSDILVAAVGLGCAGRIDFKTMQLKHCPNIPFLESYPVRQRVSKLTDAYFFMGNDVQMGLYGEHELGAAVGVDDVLAIFLGTGIGGAVLIGGKLHLGATGVAGDIGHYLVHPMGVLGGSERQGVLDDFASRTAIAAQAAAYASKQWAPELKKVAGTDLSKIRSEVLALAIKRGDKQIEELVRSRSRLVGIVLSNLVDFINPSMVLLGGGLVEAMPGLILKEVEAGIREHTTPAARLNLKVVGAKLGGQAVATGAAKMAWDQFIAQQAPKEKKNLKKRAV